MPTRISRTYPASLGSPASSVASHTRTHRRSDGSSFSPRQQAGYACFLSLLVAVLVLAGCDRPMAADEMASGMVDPAACAEDNGGLALPDGFCAIVVADSLGRLRHIAVSESGDIYVMHRQMTEGGGITALRDTTGDGRADVVDTFGRLAGTGIDLYDDFLYVADNTTIYRFALAPGELVPSSEPDTVVSGFPEQQSHAPKSFAFDESGNIFVNVGAPSNSCQEQDRTPGSAGPDPCPHLERQAGVWQFSAGTLGQTHNDNGHLFSTGIRNAVAIAWNPVTKRLYAVQHGRDQLNQLWGDLYTTQQSAELPAEEFLVLEDGADFGWPYCYYDQFQETKVLAPEYGGDGTEVGRCADKRDPIFAFPAHYAPNDLIFYTGSHFPEPYHNGAFIAFHGSWNRSPEPQEGYQVAFLPFNGDAPADEWETFADGFKGAETLDSPASAEYRPMGLAVGPDGSLYITDSQKGRIWRVIYAGDGGT